MTKTIQQLLQQVTALELLFALTLIFALIILIFTQWKRVEKIWRDSHIKANKKKEFIRSIYEMHDQLKETRLGLEDLKQQREKDLEAVTQREQKLCSSLEALSIQIIDIAKTLEEIEQRNGETKVAELKDKIYRYFNEIEANGGRCTKNQFEILKGLIEEYYKNNGNSFVKTEIEPTMYTWEIMGENDYEN